MEKEQLQKRISELETLNDQLVAELRYLDELLKAVGFTDGLKTIKLAAEELLEQTRNSTKKKEID